MNVLFLERAGERIQAETLQGPITEDLPGDARNDDRLTHPELFRTDFALESLGEAALTLADRRDGASGSITDNRGNIVPTQTMDLRAVYNGPDWVHSEGVNVHRVLSLDVPKAITTAYRALRPVGWTDWMPGARGSSSHQALAAITAGGGWTAFWHYAVPKAGKNGPADWVEKDWADMG